MHKNEVLEQLQPLTQVETKQVEHQPKTRIVVTPDMVMLRPGSGGKLVPFKEQGVKSMAAFCGIPQKFGQDLTPDTFGRVATELLGVKERYNVLLDGGEIIDFADYRGARTIQPERLVRTIEQTIKKVEYHRVSVLANQYAATLELVGDKQQAVRRGDMIRAGALVHFSPIGTIRPMVQSYVLRLACTNGATDNTIIREFRAGGGGDGDDIWQWFRQSVGDAYQSLDGIVDRYRDMTRERIPANQRAAMLEAMLKEAHITGDDADAVRAMAIQEPPRNTYELMNLITWASSHILDEPGGIRRARAAAATFVNRQEHARMCPLCHSRN